MRAPISNAHCHLGELPSSIHKTSIRCHVFLSLHSTPMALITSAMFSQCGSLDSSGRYTVCSWHLQHCFHTRRMRYRHLPPCSNSQGQGLRGHPLTLPLHKFKACSHLKWLRNNGKGYACASIASRLAFHIDVLAYSYDIPIVITDWPRLQCQADKITRYAQWTSLQVSPPKRHICQRCFVCLLAHCSDKYSNGTKALKTIQLAGRSTPHLSPIAPYYQFGVSCTMALN